MLFIGLLHASLSVFAERPSLVLSLDECLEMARRNNRQMRISQADVAIAEALLMQARSHYWPSLSMNVVASTMDEDPVYSFSGGELAPGVSIPDQRTKAMDKDNMTASLVAIYPLYTGGKRAAVNRRARAGVEAAEQLIRRSDLEVRRDVTRFYYGAVLTRELYRVADDAVLRLEGTLQLTESLYQTGTGLVKKTDYLRNKAVLGMMMAVREEVGGRRDKASRALVHAMGLERSVRVIPADDRLPPVCMPEELDELLARAFRQNPERIRIQAGIEAAEARVREQQSGYLPTLGIFASYHHTENSYDMGLMDPANKQLGMVGLRLDMPLFEGFRTQQEVAEARSELDKLRLQEEALLEGLSFSLELAHIASVQSVRKMQALESSVEAARENRSLNERAYREELVEAREVTQAQLLEAYLDQQYLQSGYDFLEKRLEIDFLLGEQDEGSD
jgi:outer membrane protein